MGWPRISLTRCTIQRNMPKEESAANISGAQYAARHHPPRRHSAPKTRFLASRVVWPGVS
jgi:hypothetical protein